MSEVRWINRAKIGAVYHTQPFEVTAQGAEAYARAVCDFNPRYLDADHSAACAPLLYAVRPLMDVVESVLNDEELNVDMLRLVHGEQDMRFARPLRLGEVVVPSAEVLSVDEKGSGQLLRVRQWLHVGDEEVCDTTSSYFIRHPKSAIKPKEGAKRSKTKTVAEPPPEPTHRIEQEVDAIRAKEYAHASGDLNAIHLDAEVAQKAGLPDVILHGLCTMAFAARAVVNALAAHDPTRLTRLRVRFARPVLLQQTLCVKLWANGEEGCSFLIEDAQGTPVVVQGVAELRSSS